jgi:hypothetical protein
VNPHADTGRSDARRENHAHRPEPIVDDDRGPADIQEPGRCGNGRLNIDGATAFA